MLVADLIQAGDPTGKIIRVIGVCPGAIDDSHLVGQIGSITRVTSMNMEVAWEGNNPSTLSLCHDDEVEVIRWYTVSYHLWLAGGSRVSTQSFVRAANENEALNLVRNEDRAGRDFTQAKVEASDGVETSD